MSPYLRFELSERTSLWGLVGYGTGDLTISRNDGAARKVRTDLDMRLFAGGVRGTLLDSAGTGGLDLALKADAFLTRIDAAAPPDTAATRAEATRVWIPPGDEGLVGGLLAEDRPAVCARADAVSLLPVSTALSG